MQVIDPKRSFGARCKALRLERKLTQLDMVRLHGYGLSYYQRIERGVLDVRLATMVRLADAFGVPLSQLLDGVYAPTPSQ